MGMKTGENRGKEREGIKNKHQLSLTNPYDALHHGKRAANKAGRSV